MDTLPLQGIRITDLTQVWAGPKCTQILADLGAEVIKIESPRRSDPARGTTNLLGLERYPNRDRGTRPHNRSGYFNSSNRNKYGITLDLRLEAGGDVFKRLVSISDVVIDNFSAGVMERLNVGYQVLREVKPDIIVVSMPGFGSNGPDSQYVAWAETIEALAGLCTITGYQSGPPMFTYQALSDPVAGMFGAVAVLTALRHHRETGEGQYVDLSQLEALINLNVEPLLGWVMNGRVQGRSGNSHHAMAPHGCYPCRGHDSWVTIAVTSDEEWRRLCQAVGDPDWAVDARFCHLRGRLEHRQELDDRIANWTKAKTAQEVQAILQAAGIACGPVLNVEEVTKDSHLIERRLFEEVDHAEVGAYPYYQAMSARFPQLDLKTRKQAPCFGADNYCVLRELLGMPDEEITRLEREQVITMEPLEPVLIQVPQAKEQNGPRERAR